MRRNEQSTKMIANRLSTLGTDIACCTVYLSISLVSNGFCACDFGRPYLILWCYLHPTTYLPFCLGSGPTQVPLLVPVASVVARIMLKSRSKFSVLAAI